jgi:hypothetical protein
MTRTANVIEERLMMMRDERELSNFSCYADAIFSLTKSVLFFAVIVKIVLFVFKLNQSKMDFIEIGAKRAKSRAIHVPEMDAIYLVKKKNGTNYCECYHNMCFATGKIIDSKFIPDTTKPHTDPVSTESQLAYFIFFAELRVESGKSVKNPKQLFDEIYLK